MKKHFFSLLALLSCISAHGQNTFIPDDHFELALIEFGLDDVMNDSVATGNIDTLSYLHISWRAIDDLTGIEDFASLIFLQAGSNNLTSLNVSQNSQLTTLHCDLNNLSTLTLGSNPHLKHIFCRANLLTNIDLSELPALYTLSIENNLLTQLNVSHNPLLDYLNVQGNLLWNLNLGANPLLEGLNCSETPVTTLDLSQNTLLNTLYCFTTQLTELDVSQNPGILFLHCNDIPTLQRLNMKSGNNTGLLVLEAVNNPELFCIEVDTPAYSQQNWTNVDSWVSFEEDCMLNLEESAGNPFSLFPNPVVDQIYFSTPLNNLSIQDISGRMVQTITAPTPAYSVFGLPKGIYILRGTTENGKTITTRFIRQEF